MKSGTDGRNGSAPVLIAGGCGFIGTNLAHAFLSEGRRVILYDNLSGPGTEENLLRRGHTVNLDFVSGDVGDISKLVSVVREAAEVYHFAAQVAVTTSLAGTLNLLEAVRGRKNPPFLLFTSTNKVYGELAGVVLREAPTRREPEDEGLRKNGITEAQPLDFQSPYGCSKGASDQYILHCSRNYGIPAVVFRMSCIHGTHRFGTEDQGWVAHFLIRALRGEKIPIYGDGKQVRDILFVVDLVAAMKSARRFADRTRGKAFNIGGATANTVGLPELLDQKYNVSDISRLSRSAGREPGAGVREGVGKLLSRLETRFSPTARHRESGSPGHEGRVRLDAVGPGVEGVSKGDRVAVLSCHACAEYDLADARAALAASRGARVTALSRWGAALETARTMGAAHVVPMDDYLKATEAVKAVSGHDGCDCVIEAAGKQRPLELVSELVKMRGRLVIAGFHQDGPRQVNMQNWNRKGLDVISARERDPDVYIRGMRKAVEPVTNRTLDPSPLFTHRISLEDFSRAATLMQERPAGFMKALVSV